MTDRETGTEVVTVEGRRGGSWVVYRDDRKELRILDPSPELRQALGGRLMGRFRARFVDDRWHIDASERIR